MRRFLGMTLLILASPAGLSPEALDAQERSSRGRWSVSTSLTFPLVRIYQVYRIDDRNEVSMGPAFQHYRHESFTANAYTLVLRYRRCLTDQLSVEAEIYL